ncbi:MAG: nitrite reductase (NAD(P)H) small subunit [Ignavibacteriales bacterium]|nr:nitrite reductase (NAD(P)H) small subunit [Ignavibacteriales bacterium]
MEGYVKVAEMSEFSVRRAKRVLVDSVDVALFFVEDQLYAVQNDCPHQHFSMLHEGMLNGCEITCPMHGWTFDLKTGKATIGSGTLKQYVVKIQGNSVWLKQPVNSPTWG